MKFRSRHIELAIKFKALGLAWEPSVGNYVYDATGAVKPTSPFQQHVYFLLNYDCFMDRVGGVERFKTIMTWLPTWSDAREVLRSLDVSDKQVQDELVRSGALKDGSELLQLYELIDQQLSLTHETVRSPTLRVCDEQ